MSYAVTEAGEEDMTRELNTLEALEEEIDQLASEARRCDTIAPYVQYALDLAWWFAEEAFRDARGRCSAGCDGKKYCQCCKHFEELTYKARSLRGRL